MGKFSGCTCHQCGSRLYVGHDAFYEATSGEFFCDEGCYRKFVRENLDDFMSAIMEYYEVKKQVVGV